MTTGLEFPFLIIGYYHCVAARLGWDARKLFISSSELRFCILSTIKKKNAKIDSIIELELDKDVRVAATSNRSMNSGSESGNMSSDCSTGGCTPRMTYGQQSLQPAKKKKAIRAQNKEQVEGVIVLTLKTAYASRA
jgi:hypothetical protein